MARASRSNIIEQHVEKIVLGVSVVLFLWLLFRSVFYPAREFNIPKVLLRYPPWSAMKNNLSGDDARKSDAERVSIRVPRRKIDEGLQETIGIIQEDMDRKEPEGVLDEQWEEKIRKLQASPLPSTVTPMISFAEPPRPITITVPATPGKIHPDQLTSRVPKPEKPLVIMARELPQTEKPMDVVAAHVAAVYPWGQLVEGWSNVLQNTPVQLSVLVLGVRAQMRKQLGDGSWSDPVSVKMTARPLEDSAGRKIRIPQDIPALPEYDGKNVDEVSQAITVLSQWQPYILQPDFWPIWWPGYNWVDWRVHLPKTSVSETPGREETPGGVAPPPEIRRPVEPRRATDMRAIPGAMPPTVPPGSTSRRPGVTAPPMMPGEIPGMYGMPSTTPPWMTTPPRTTPPAATRQPSAGTSLRPPTGMPQDMRGAYPPDMMPPMGPGRMMPRPVAPRPVPAARPAPVRPAAAPAEEEPQPPPEPTYVPDLRQQMLDGKVLVCLHDTSLESMKGYQFRVQLELLNPLLGFDEEVSVAAFARQRSILTEWSDWSDRVFVPQAAEFFLTGSFAPKKWVKVTVFAHRFGQRVREDFNIYEGQPIGQKTKVKVINPTTDERETQEVDFSTGGLAIQFDFEKLIEKGGINTPSVEILYLDDAGELRTRDMLTDRASPQYIKLLRETKQPSAGPAAGAGSGTAPPARKPAPPKPLTPPAGTVPKAPTPPPMPPPAPRRTG